MITGQLQAIYHDILTRLRNENENLLARVDELEADLAHAEDTIEMYEEEEDRELDALIDQAFDEMMLEAQL